MLHYCECSIIHRLFIKEDWSSFAMEMQACSSTGGMTPARNASSVASAEVPVYVINEEDGGEVSQKV